MEVKFQGKDGETSSKIHVYYHSTDQQASKIFECEVAKDDYFEYGLSLTNFLGQFTRNDELYTSLGIVADEIKRVTRYDRVLIYEFDSFCNGKVMIEKSDSSPRFLGLQFPASDIPLPAREMFSWKHGIFTH
eukprot:TRINITY_DN15366_c0_g1_i1.p1 TRINITY_DN15366_c0_g1~~TRINITY_DN15366_c0_g1_i1.p1  ORF type:complete len:154 (+),score=49.00 TRINITY_DN15366_c0_g1_i1:67-462(+)